jgi:hypothetical protein
VAPLSGLSEGLVTAEAAKPAGWSILGEARRPAGAALDTGPALKVEKALADEHPLLVRRSSPAHRSTRWPVRLST